MIKLLAAGLFIALTAALIAATHVGVPPTQHYFDQKSLEWNTAATHVGVPPPLKQLAAGVPPEDIRCSQYMVLVMRDRGSPVCAYAGLIERKGWSVVNVDGMSYHNCEAMRVMSPEHDWGCVDGLSARFLENSGWFVLDEYPEDIASSSAFEHIGSLGQDKRYHRDRHIDGGLKIDLRMPELPLVGQSADVMLDVVSPHTASPVNAAFRITFIGDVEVLSSDPPLKPVESLSDVLPGRGFYTPRTEMLPGETRQFIVTVMPLSETPLQVSADGYDEHGYYVTQSGDVIRFSIGGQSSGYQLDGDSYARDPDTEYVWIQIPYPQCWFTPWDRSGQTVYDYYADRGIEIHDTMRLPAPRDACEGCQCLDGSMLFLTPEYDRADVLLIDFVSHPDLAFP